MKEGFYQTAQWLLLSILISVCAWMHRLVLFIKEIFVFFFFLPRSTALFFIFRLETWPVCVWVSVLSVHLAICSQTEQQASRPSLCQFITFIVIWNRANGAGPMQRCILPCWALTKATSPASTGPMVVVLWVLFNSFTGQLNLVVFVFIWNGFIWNQSLFFSSSSW